MKALLAVVCLGLVGAPAFASQLITNGGFETGSLSGWNTLGTTGSDDLFFADNTGITPLNGFATVGADSGSWYAVSDMTGLVTPESSYLTQNVTIPLAMDITVSFDIFVNDEFGSSGTGGEVAFWSSGANPLTDTPVFVVYGPSDTAVLNGNPNTWTPVSVAVTADVTPGTTYQFGALESDSTGPINVGLDNLSVTATPEPATLFPSAFILAGLFLYLSRRKVRAGLSRIPGEFPMNLLKVSRVLLFTAAAAAVLAPSASAQVKPKVKAQYKPVMPGPNAAGHMRSHAMIVYYAPDAVHGPGQTSCSSGCYYTPADLITAYAIGSIAHGNGGAGMTVGIVDAYYNSQTSADLNAAISAFGLASCSLSPSNAPLTGCLTIVTQTGCSVGAQGCTAPGSNDNWAVETDLDVQIVHALAPNAKILLVVCNSTSDADLFTGVEYAAAHSSVVTGSWGGAEFSGETVNDSYFSSSTVPVLFSSGDTGAQTEYPCTSIYALCVGGTSLLETATSFRNIEGAWGNTTWSGNNSPDGGGGGCSAHVSAPSFQSGYNTCSSGRGVPDVSAVADPNTGFYVYLGSFAAAYLGDSAGLHVIGGTSLASPLTAAVIANIDADRVYNSKSKLGSNLNALIYEAAASYRYRFYDVTVGSSSNGTTTYNAATGWDKATGLGVILGPSLATYLLTTP